MLRHRLFCIAAAAVLDLVIGDPEWMPHPVRWIGRLITVLEGWLRGQGGQKNPASGQEAQNVKEEATSEREAQDVKEEATSGQKAQDVKAETAPVQEKSNASEKPIRIQKANHRNESPIAESLKGAILVLIVLIVTAVATVLTVRVMYAIHPVLGTAAEIILCCYTLAARNLQDSAMAVYRPLVRRSIERARKAVSMIVGRDTSALDAEGIAKAAVETVAENTADGVIAPMFYLFLGGTTGGMIYKAVNTMDSMLGYQNEEYRYFGTAAARLDDVAGFLPARLSALCLIAAARITGMDAKGAYRIFRRDRYKHKSPNAAQSESAVAGALGVQLAGDAVYFGEVVHKPFIGDPVRKIEAGDIPRACRLMMTASGVFLAAWAVVCLILPL